MQDDGSLRGERCRDEFILFVKRAAVLVQYLQHADQGVLEAKQRNGQHAARAVAGLLVDGAVESRVGIAVRDVDQPAGLRRFADDAHVRRDADLPELCRHADDKLVRFFVIQKYRSPVGVQDVARDIDDLAEHRVEVKRRSQLASDLEDAA